MDRTGCTLRAVLLLASLGVVSVAVAKEYPIWVPQKRDGMEIAAVYLQPIEMDGPGMLAAQSADIHIEADIKALKDNPNGFAEGDWIPYLAVKFTLKKDGEAEARSGEFMPMVANDGPHYGDNVKLMGPGKYTLVLSVAPPANEGHARFGRHIDKETGVGAWFKPFDATYEFTFAGTGKKGAY